MAEPIVKQIGQFLIVYPVGDLGVMVIDSTDGEVLDDNSDTTTLAAALHDVAQAFMSERR